MPARGLTKAERPYRIFDEAQKKDLPWRSYKTLDKAIDKTLSILWRLHLGTTYTIYDANGYKGIIQFTRKVDGIQVLADPSLRFRDYLPDGELRLPSVKPEIVNAWSLE